MVDDVKTNRLLLGRYLELQGHRVMYAENGRQALELLRSCPVELMLLDIEMPEMNGYSVLEQVLADPRLRDTPVIITSALEEMDSVVKCIQMGAEDYLTKPVDQVLLKARIDASLEKKRLRDRQRDLLRKMEIELDFARQIQRSMLPESAPSLPGYDLGALMEPARAVGGDFYEFLDFGRGRTAIILGDVSDKGVPAALFMALTFSLIHAEADPDCSPREVLERVNRYLVNMNAADMFVTLFFGILDGPSGTFDYARAGHPAPVLLGGDGRPLAVKPGPGAALGVFDDLVLDENRITLEEGGVMLLFSDCLTELIHGDGHSFGGERIVEQLVRLRERSAGEICQELWQSLQAFTGDAVQQDDFTAVVIKKNGKTE